MRYTPVIWLIAFGMVLSAKDSLSDQIHAAQTAGNYAEAGSLYLKLIADGDDSPEIRSNCGVMLHLAGKNREALDQFRIALHQAPNLISANLFAGLSEFEMGQPKAALPYIQKAQQLDPGRPAPVLALGKVYVAMRDYGQANQSYAKAVALDSGLAEGWYGLGVTDRSLAKEMLNRAASKGKAISQETRDQAQRMLDGAVEALTRAVELDPDSARTHLLVAESLSDAGKFVEAVPEYQAALKLDPGLDAAYLGLATEYWKQRQFDQALPLLRRLLVKSPNDPESNALMADILEHNGDVRNAQTFAEAALRGNPDLIQTRVVLARIYLAKQQPRLAITELRKIIATDTDGSYHFLLYRACRAAGDQRGAQEAMAEFQQIRYGAPKQ